MRTAPERRSGLLRPEVAVALLLAPALLGAKCGPTDQEAGAAVLLAGPFMIGQGVLLLWGMSRLWRRARPEIPWRPGPALWGVGLSTLAAVGVAVALRDTDATRWVGMAWILAGSSYLTILLVTWRLWMLVSPGAAFAWAWLPAALVELGAAAAAAGGYVEGDAMEVVGGVWIWPGYWGLVTVAVLLVLVLEGAIRARRA